jgi:hypothetical protein
MDGNEHGEGPAGQGEESRAYSRYSVDEECTLLFVNHGLPMKARIADLSLEGCRLRTNERFPAKAGRVVEVTFKVKGFAFRFSGAVRWSDGQHMVGIHFENMIARRKEELVELIDEMAASIAAKKLAAEKKAAEEAAAALALAAAEAAKAAKAEAAKAEAAAAKAAKAEAAKTLALEPAERAPEAAAGKPAAEAETEAKSEPPAPKPAKARDRRGQARHEVDTTASIFLVNVGSALRGRIVDLSLGGCRIRTDERFPVGIYTRVEAEFHLQGLPFRLGGVIQAIHNRFTVGIRFLDLSDRKRQQVLDLIDEIDEMQAAMPQNEEPSGENPDQAASR